jgi:hypothetical protein
MFWRYAKKTENTTSAKYFLEEFCMLKSTKKGRTIIHKVHDNLNRIFV